MQVAMQDFNPMSPVAFEDANEGAGASDARDAEERRRTAPWTVEIPDDDRVSIHV